MRAAIKTALSGVLTVYDQNIVTAQTAKPYGVLVADGGEQDINFSKAYNTRFALWLYVEPVNYTPLDTLIDNVLASLTNTLLTTSGGKNFELKYVNKGTEFFDNDFNANGIDLYFSTVDRIL